eukprot:7700187-Karenia_brevis.AAC.1
MPPPPLECRRRVIPGHAAGCLGLRYASLKFHRFLTSFTTTRVSRVLSRGFHENGYNERYNECGYNE